ncbi:MAG: hypothetical protein V3V05_07035 [Pontiella sp.]
MKTMLSLLILLSVLSPLHAQQRGFTFHRLLDQHDENNDGEVSRSEFSGNSRMFEQMDRNKDDLISNAEFDAAMKERKAARSNTGSRKSIYPAGSSAGPKNPRSDRL